MPADSPLDARLRVLGVMLEPALILACVLRVPLGDLVTLTRNGYVRVGKQRGMSVRAMAKRFGVVPATVQSIAAASRNAKLGAEVRRRRLVVALLTDRAGASMVEIARAVPDATRAEVENSVADLVASGIVGRKEGEFSLRTPYLSAVGGDLERRLDAVRLILESVTQVIYRRFFERGDADATALPRGFRFGARREDLAAFAESYAKRIEEAAITMDAALPEGHAEKRACSVVLSIVEEPQDPFYRARASRETP